MKPVLGGCAGFFFGAWTGAYVVHLFAAAFGGNAPLGIGAPGQFWWNIPLVLTALCWTAICTALGARRCGADF